MATFAATSRFFDAVITILFQIESGDVKKQYIARVIGVFPENEVLKCQFSVTLIFHA